MNRVLIVVTSYRLRPDRVYTGSDEWRDGWRFSGRSNYMVRNRKDAKPTPVNSVSELPTRAGKEDTLIWIRGQDPQKATFSETQIGNLVQQLREANEVYLAYHDEFVGDKVAKILGKSREGFFPYTLSRGANPEGFKAILKTDELGEAYLDAEV